MAERLRSDARRNRARVLAVAEQAFAAEGTSVPVREIARRADVGAGTVGRHFPTKEELLRAVIVGVLQRLITQAHALAEAPDPGDAFFTFFLHLVQEGRTNKALFDTLADPEMDLKSATSTTTAEFGRRLGKLLRRAQRVGAVRTDLTESDLKALLVGALAAQARATDPGSAERLTAVVCQGLRSPTN
jgi:AcrR family transcriptional regulator